VAERETPFRRVHEVAGDSEVQKDPVHQSKPELVEENIQVREVSPDPDEPRISLQPSPCSLQGLRVLVDPDQAARWPHPLQQRLAVSPPAQGPVDQQPPRARLQAVHRHIQQDRNVAEVHQLPTSFSTGRSGTSCRV